LGSRQSIALFFVAVVLILGMFFIVKTYRELSGEYIVVESEEDLVVAKERVKENAEKLEQDTVKLRTLVGLT
jgi:hypothetical protein